MTTAATRITAIGALAAAGCFFDSINGRPSLDIRIESSDPVYRGASLELKAVVDDPERQRVELNWRVYACADAIAGECDDDPVYTGTEETATLRVPVFRADPDGTGPQPAPPVESLRVLLAGADDHGAEARPAQELIVPVLNHPPTIELRAASRDKAVVTAPVEIFAKYGDPDDTPENVTFAWVLFSPSQQPPPLEDISVPLDPRDPDHVQVGVRFTPMVTGTWKIAAVATDKRGTRTEQQLTLPVVEDGPPCLAVWQPFVAATPAPITFSTRFQVNHVRDDLDAFPRLSDAPGVGETRFEWSLRVGAEARRSLGPGVDSLVIEPRDYALGTILEVRVEIFDRKAVQIRCADADATCSVNSRSDCLQRLTWRVEVR